MRPETLVLDCLKRKHQKLNIDDELMNGICEYISDNHIEQLLSDIKSIETSTFLIESFLEPILDFPQNIVEEYFGNYALIKAFKQESNNIFQKARCKYDNEQYSFNKEDEDKLISILSRIYSNSSLKNNLITEISDVLLDLDYVKKNSQKYSIRLSKWIEKR